MEGTFKFGLGDVVKVQVFNFVTKGEITKRVSYETKLGINFKYEIQFGESYEQSIDVWEHELLQAQGLPLGEIL
tara:strand:- start:1051 stop:1272 length:222 start_codon:yes stop_codon:yes gene_type:complete